MTTIPEIITQDGKIYKHVIYEVGEVIRAGTMYLRHDGSLMSSAQYGCRRLAGDPIEYYHAVGDV